MNTHELNRARAHEAIVAALVRRIARQSGRPESAVRRYLTGDAAGRGAELDIERTLRVEGFGELSRTNARSEP